MDEFNPEDTVLATDFKKRIEASNIYLCELHFKPECILTSMLARRCEHSISCTLVDSTSDHNLVGFPDSCSQRKVYVRWVRGLFWS